MYHVMSSRLGGRIKERNRLHVAPGPTIARARSYCVHARRRYFRHAAAGMAQVHQRQPAQPLHSRLFVCVAAPCRLQLAEHG